MRGCYRLESIPEISLRAVRGEGAAHWRKSCEKRLGFRRERVEGGWVQRGREGGRRDEMNRARDEAFCVGLRKAR